MLEQAKLPGWQQAGTLPRLGGTGRADLLDHMLQDLQAEVPDDGRLRLLRQLQPARHADGALLLELFAELGEGRPGRVHAVTRRGRRRQPHPWRSTPGDTRPPAPADGSQRLRGRPGPARQALAHPGPCGRGTRVAGARLPPSLCPSLPPSPAGRYLEGLQAVPLRGRRVHDDGHRLHQLLAEAAHLLGGHGGSGGRTPPATHGRDERGSRDAAPRMRFGGHGDTGRTRAPRTVAAGTRARPTAPWKTTTPGVPHAESTDAAKRQAKAGLSAPQSERLFNRSLSRAGAGGGGGMSRGRERVVALVDMDCFFMQVEQRLDPQLRGRPCAVVQYTEWQGGG